VQLEEQLEELFRDRCYTNGHGRRARIQERIDAIAARLEELPA
jgi:hypothetical protein